MGHIPVEVLLQIIQALIDNDTIPIPNLLAMRLINSTQPLPCPKGHLDLTS
jgi:hypothetical protein